MSTLSINHLRKRFDPNSPWVVDDFTLDIASGELVTLLGPSGCGKTTVLRMIAGLEHPDAGDIQIDGRSVAGLKPGERDVALVFQQYALYPNMTVAENLEYPLRSLRIPKEERKRMVRSTAEMLELTLLLERLPGALSGGEQQRAAVGRALIRNPRVYLLDEPLANLDAQLRLRTRSMIKELQKCTGITCLVVTHDQSEAMALAHRIVVMDGGRIQQISTPDELYQRPSNAFVAGFIGSPPMNLLPANRLDDEIVSEGGLRLPVPFDGNDDESWTIGVRPEDIEIVTSGEGALAAIVAEVEPQGHETLIRAQFGTQPIWIRTGPKERPAPGSVIHLRIKTALHLFGPGGERVEKATN